MSSEGALSTMNVLQERGWFLTESGYNLVSDYGNITDIKQLIKRLVNFDYKEIGSGEGNINENNLILQIQKIRNISAPKNNEESRTAPRMLKLSLTDGKNNYQAVEMENISSLSLNTLPGSKILLKSKNLSTTHGILLLRPCHIGQFLGGNVINLVEKWVLNKKLAVHSRIRSVEEGGPPPWIQFGQKIINIIDQKKNFKALSDKDKILKENSEFEAQRKGAIAEAAKQGQKKVFGGGNKQLLDHSVQKIMEHGFTIEQAEYALKMNRNDINRALKSLQKSDNKLSKDIREPKGRRFEKRNEESGKPSSGKVSLFDFLEDKLFTQVESININDNESETRDTECEQPSEYLQSNRGGRTQRGGGRSYQNISRRLDGQTNKGFNANMTDTPRLHNSTNSNNQQNKPPRFQTRNNEFQNLPQQDTPQNRQFNRNHSNGIQNKNQVMNSGKQFEFRNRQANYEASYSRQNHLPDNSNQQDFRAVDSRSHRNFKSKFYTADDSYVQKGASMCNSQQVTNDFSSRQAYALAGGSWIWQKGDICLAKYWEDNMYYTAEVFAVSDRTCVVQFKDFNNFEEVLQADCIPVCENNQQNNAINTHNFKSQDYRMGNRASRHDSGNQINGIEFRRGDNLGNGGRNHKKRTQQRISQPIYQPPATRNVSTLHSSTVNIM